MITALDIATFLSQSREHLTLDVRSEGEYNYGHIPHAISLPLFTNEERKAVGTTYKQYSRNEAILLGLDIVGKKMGDFVRFVQPLVKENKIFIHCWRGGMRSSSMAWLFDLFGYEVYLLKGGYKNYRHLVTETLASPYPYIVIGGKTGSGKTEVLHQLREAGEQIIDLEGLANHKGSAFGMLGQPPQPSTEHFENLLHLELSRFDLTKRIWVEDESKKIGTVVLDNQFWHYIKHSRLMVLELPAPLRVKRLVTDYAENQSEGLKQSLTNIKKKLGGLEWKRAMDALEQKDFETTAGIALQYYDKTYEHCMTQKETKEIYRFVFEEDDMQSITFTLIKEANKQDGKS